MIYFLASKIKQGIEIMEINFKVVILILISLQLAVMTMAAYLLSDLLIIECIGAK